MGSVCRLGLCCALGGRGVCAGWVCAERWVEGECVLGGRGVCDARMGAVCGLGLCCVLSGRGVCAGWVCAECLVLFYWNHLFSTSPRLQGTLEPGDAGW